MRRRFLLRGMVLALLVTLTLFLNRPSPQSAHALTRGSSDQHGRAALVYGGRSVTAYGGRSVTVYGGRSVTAYGGNAVTVYGGRAVSAYGDR